MDLVEMGRVDGLGVEDYFRVDVGRAVELVVRVVGACEDRGPRRIAGRSVGPSARAAA